MLFSFILLSILLFRFLTIQNYRLHKPLGANEVSLCSTLVLATSACPQAQFEPQTDHKVAEVFSAIFVYFGVSSPEKSGSSAIYLKRELQLSRERSTDYTAAIAAMGKNITEVAEMKKNSLN